MRDQVDICIVGSGFSGLGAAIKLLEEGERDFVVLERGDDVGGTWHFNTYPGCGCDVPSHLYSFSFAPNPEWSQTYSLQPEIRAYLQRVADDFGVRPYVELNTTMTGASWDDEDERWTVETDRGTLRARVLITGMGPLAEPRMPDIPGIDSFEGEVMHSARWDDSVELEGKRVASIGTGASAIQYVPEVRKVAETAARLPAHPAVGPPPHQPRDQAVGEAPVQALSAGTAAQPGRRLRHARGGRAGHGQEPQAAQADGARGSPAHQEPGQGPRAAQEGHAGLRHRLQADPALEQVVPGAVGRQRRAGHRGRQGGQAQLDRRRERCRARGRRAALGTGFQVADMPLGKVVTGRSGQTLDETWNGSPRAMLGSTAPDFPNLFMLLGPNTGLGHNSMVYMIESQIAYVMDALRAMRQHGAKVVEVRPEAAEAFNQEIDQRHVGTVWSSGCASWYLDDTGRNATLWPDWTFMFRKRTSSFNPAHYRLEPA